ncbi:MAG: PAS domain S-box protein [Anaerolineales bacterium]|nr:PAS domain S-box protein [Anaerolineales bacterium]
MGPLLNNPTQKQISSEIVQALFETADEAIFVVDDTGRLLEANAAACQITGYGRNTLLQRSLADLITPPLPLLPGSPLSGPQQMLNTENGRSLPITLATRPLADGRSLLIIRPAASDHVPAGTDDALLRHILNTIPDPLWLKSPEGRFLACNPAFEEYTGLSEAELLGKTDYDVSETHLADYFVQQDRKVLEAGKPLTNEEWVTTRGNGRRILLETVKTPLYDSSGHLLGVLGIAREITERKLTETALQEQVALQTQLTQVAETVPGMVCSFLQAADGSVSMPFTTPALDEVYGLDAAELAQDASSLFAIIHPDDLKHVGETIQESAQTMSQWHAEYRVLHPRKGEVWIEGRSMPQRQADGGILWHGFVQDITTRKRAEQAIYMMSSMQNQISLLDNLEEIYRLVGEGIQKLVGTCYTAASILDDAQQGMRVIGLYGFGSKYQRLSRKFKVDPAKLVYSLADMTPEDLRLFRSGRLENYADGLYGLLMRKVPKSVCKTVEKQLKVTGVYTIGFAWHGAHYGGLTILARGDIAPYKEMIETIMNQASLAIKRLRSEEALRTSEEKLRLFIEHAPASLAMFDRDMRYLAVSQRWMNDYQLEDQNIIGRSHYKVFPEIPARWKAFHRRGLAGEVIRTDEDDFLREDGSVQWLRWEVRPWYTAVGSIGGIVIFTEDITERKWAREALRESQEILAQAESVAKIGSWKWNLTSQKVTWSDEMFNLFGVDRQNFDGDVARIIQERIHPDDIEAVNQSNLSVLEEQNPLPLEYRIVLPDGTQRSVWAEGRLTYDKAGQPTALIGYVQDITERKAAEKSLRESQEILAQAELAANMGSWRWDLATQKASWSEGMYRIFAIDRENDDGDVYRAIHSRVHPDDMEAALQAVVTAFQKNRPVALETRIILPDGTERVVWVEGKLVPDRDGRPTAVVGYVQDITERKQAEKALEEMAENMAAAQQITHSGSWEVRLTADLQFEDPQMWSDECYRIFGVEPGSLSISREFFYTHVHPDDRQVAQQSLQQAVQEGSEAVYEYRLIRPDGAVRTLHDRVKAVVDPGSGRPVKVVGIVQDITESRQAEATIAQLNRRMELILNSAGEGIYGSDVDGRITFVNPAMASMLGWEPDELLGQHAHAAFHHSLADGRAFPPLDCPIQQAMLAGHEYHSDDDIYWRKDGSPLAVDFTSTPIREEGQIVGTVVVVKDITERKRAAEEQARLQEQLRQAQKMESIGRLAGGIAHDFNNQLTVIEIYSDMMLAAMAENDSLLPKLQYIRQASEHAAGLTRQLLAFSRKQILQPVVLDLNNLISNLGKMLALLIGEDVALSTKLQPALWPVTADRGQIEQVVMNLVVNARDAMPTGGQLTIQTDNVVFDDSVSKLHLDVPPGPCVLLAITDTGQGMEKETLERIFEPFFTTKQPGQGTGLGLATVHGIIKQSGGAIFVYSEPGRGSTFKVYLPASTDAVIENTVTPPPAARQRGSETILLAEDEEMLRELVHMTLQEMGYTVLPASNGREALHLAQRYTDQIDLLLTDVVMPHLSGRELSEALAGQRPKMKVLFMSGYMDDAIVRHGVLQAKVSFLPKPFTQSDLARKVRQVLDQHEGA